MSEEKTLQGVQVTKNGFPVQLGQEKKCRICQRQREKIEAGTLGLILKSLMVTMKNRQGITCTTM